MVAWSAFLDLDASGGEKVAGEIKAKGGKVGFHATGSSPTTTR
jgi:hypothetical protein